MEGNQPVQPSSLVVAEGNNAVVPAPSKAVALRNWLRRLETKEHLAFSGKEELEMLLDLYDHKDNIQYIFDHRFKGKLPVSDVSLCGTAVENLARNRTTENYPTDEGLLRTADGHFINASTIEGKDRTYIATQHPLPTTTVDFWKMVLAEKPAAVIMLNKHDYDQVLRKPDEPDLVQYWPGTSKNGDFVSSLRLEDKETGGTVTISVLPEPTTHDIEEIERISSKSSQKNSPTVATPVSPIISSPSSPILSEPSTPLTIDSTTLTTPTTPTTPLSPPTSPTIATPLSPISASTEDNAQQITLSTPNNQQTNKNAEGQVTITKTDDIPEINKIKLENIEVHGTKGFQEYKLSSNIEYSRVQVESAGQQHQLWHIRCGGWKDQEAPDIDLFMDLWHLVQEKLKSHKVNNGEKHKIVIHCTGGVGRTGTFIAVDIAGQELKEKQKGKWDEFSIEKVIHFLRQKRMNMVGSVSQYIFCHRAALSLFSGANTYNHATSNDENSNKPVAALT